MMALLTNNGQVLTWVFQLDDSDGTYTEKIQMIEHSFSMTLPKNIDFELIHPDHLALITLLTCHPFIGTELHLPWSVSEGFADAAKRVSSYTISFKDCNHPPYVPESNARPGLAFSGGADSTACLLTMPENSLSVFMDRPLRKKTSLYNKSAAYATIEHAQEIGFEVLKVSCDVEYMRSPLGFPTDLVPSIPLIAIASQQNIDSISFGTVMESAYRIGHEKARDYASSHHYRLWGHFFAAVGLPLYLPVAGVSEVGTSKIVFESSFHRFTRSCIRGSWPQSCENCWKCFRKTMIDTKFIHQSIEEEYLHSGLKIREVQNKLKAWPVSHENVLAWTLQGSHGRLAELLGSRLEGTGRDLSYLESYYPPSLDLLPPQYQAITKVKLQSFLPAMKPEYWALVNSHTMTNWLNSPKAKNARDTFLSVLVNEFQVN